MAGGDGESALPFPLGMMTVRSTTNHVYRVECSICGWTGSASLHKILYGHFLQHNDVHIGKCISRSKLEEKHQDFYAQLIEREQAYENKRQ